ncbi:MAG: hypothetical protein WKF57_13850 [Nakamurella sp.]
MAIWILLCLGGALLLHDRPLWMACGGFGLWVFIPGVAGVLFTGRGDGLLALHPATWFILACFVVLLIRRPVELMGEFAARWPLYLTLVLVILTASIMSLMGSQPPGVVLVTDQITGPIMLFWFASVAIRRAGSARVVLRNVVLAVAAVQSVIAIAQFALKGTIFFSGRYHTNYWFTDSWDRWMGTTDHPLVLSMLLCASAPLVAGLRRASLQVGLLGLMAVGVLITQSRTAALILPVTFVYVIFRSRAGAGAKVLLTTAVVAGAAGILASPLVDGLADRLTNDSGSTDARTRAVSFFLDSFNQFIVYGDGITTSYRVAALGGLRTSLESSFLMYAIGIGVIATVIYFGAQVALVVSAFGSDRLRGVLVSGLVVLIMPQTFSSLGTESVCGPLLWVMLALIASGRLPSVRQRSRPPPQLAGVPGDQVAARPSISS